MKSPFAALRLIAVATLLAGSITNAPAIAIRNPNGAVIELKYLSGTVSRVDQSRHSFTLTWKGKGMLKMERYWPSYQEDYQVTDGTVYKNGSWANMQKGSHVRIAGHSYVATFVEFTTQIADKAAGAADEHRANGNSLFNSTIDTQNAVTYFDRGLAKQKKGDLDGAMADYNQAIKLNPNDAAAYNARGVLRKKKSDLDGAMADYNQAIKLDPKFAFAYNNRGNVSRKKGDLNGAVADYDRAIKLNPNYPSPYKNRGYVKFIKGDFDGAMADYNQAIKLSPRYAFAYNDRGIVKEGKGDLDGAIADFNEAIRINPKYAAAYRNRGDAKRKKGDVKGSIADFDHALKLGLQSADVPENPD
jgi:tetratricopeptide (TPR) repeat protein